MADPFVAEIRIFAFNFAPAGWAFCQGQLLPISQNTALFSLIGTFYGGNGTSNFALPNLQASAVVGTGQGVGLSPYVVGETGGETTVTLTSNQMPAHTHTMPVSTVAGHTDTPAAGLALGATSGRGDAPAYGATANTTMSLASTTITGGGGAHNNLMPYLTLNFCIALQGIYPARN